MISKVSIGLISGLLFSLMLFRQVPVYGQCDTAFVSKILRKASSSSPDSAKILYQDAIRIMNKCLAASGQKTKGILRVKLVKAYNELGLIYYQAIRYDEASKYYLLAYSLAKETQSPALLADCMFNLAELSLEQSRYKEAMTHYIESMEQYILAGDQKDVFWCYTGMGIAQKQLGNLEDALVCYNKALDVAKKEGLKDLVATSYNNIGNVFRKKGEFSKAMESYEKAISNFRALKDEIAVSDCQNNIGNLYLDNGDPFRALDYYNQSLKIVKAAKDEYRMISRYKNLADAYTDLKDYDNASLFLDDAMKIAQKSGDKSFLASCYMQSGKIMTLKREPEVARAYYLKACSLFEQIGSKADQADAYVELSKIELLNHNISASIEYGSKACEIAGRSGSLKTRMEANLSLSEAYEVKGDERQALIYLKRSMQLKDSVYSAEKYRTIEEVEAGFVQHELKQENSVLAQNSQLQKQAIKTRNLIVILLFLSLILSVLLIRMVYRRQKEAKRESGIVKQQSEEKIGKLNEDLVSKERELTSKTIFINQKNELLERLIGELDAIKNSGSSANGNAIQQLQSRLKQELSPNAWKEFEVQFNEVHPEFQGKLLELYPGLTPAERRLCSFIRLDMNTREISSLTGQSVKSVEVARTRIRKKLNVPHELNLTNFIAKI